MKTNIHKFTRTFVASLLAVTFIAAGPIATKANADTLSTLRDKYAALQAQQQQLQTQLNGLNDKVSTQKEKKDAIDKNVKAINSQITLLNKQVDTLNAQIDSTNKDIAKTEEDIKANTEQYKERVCSIYEAGSGSKLQILLSSQSITDFFSKFETLRMISEHDNKLINDLKNDQVKLQKDKQALEEKKKSLEESKGTLAGKKQVAASQLAEQKRILSGIEDDADAVKSARNAVAQKARQTDAEINKEINRLADERRQQLAGQGGSGSVSSSYVVNYAKGFLGTRYVFGSANPSYGFDCSGFVQYVYAKTSGISLPHSAIGMSGYGSAVSTSNLQAGDLVFFATGGGSINHVGIYIGGDQFIAANSGSQMCVSIQTMLSNGYWGKYYRGARRLK